MCLPQSAKELKASELVVTACVTTCSYAWYMARIPMHAGYNFHIPLCLNDASRHIAHTHTQTAL